MENFTEIKGRMELIRGNIKVGEVVVLGLDVDVTIGEAEVFRLNVADSITCPTANRGPGSKWI